MNSTLLFSGSIEPLGAVVTVDTASVVIRVTDVDTLRSVQVNSLVWLRSSRPGQALVGVVQRITRAVKDVQEVADSDMGDKGDAFCDTTEENLLRVTLIGTFKSQEGTRINIFRRALETVPEVDAPCMPLEGAALSRFMRSLASAADSGLSLKLGKYALGEDADAWIDGNKLFQRHAIVVGSTGSGKSYTMARLLEQIAQLAHANAIVIDVHGEYEPLAQGQGIRRLRVAGPADLEANRGLDDGVLHLPYWLLGYDALLGLLVDRTDHNAPNQAMLLNREVVAAKHAYLKKHKREDLLANFTVESPIPFDLGALLKRFESLNREMVEGNKEKKKQGDYHGKLARLITRLETKRTDRRLGFLFQGGKGVMAFDWFERLCVALTGPASTREDGCGVKIIDFAEVPSDVLPLVVGVVSRMVFTLQQWTPPKDRHPIALLCDEAHLYIPDRAQSEASAQGASTAFERIAKEGRKYGVGLLLASQRPSEVSRTVLSQCGNMIAMRLTNMDDQNVVRRMLPDSLGGVSDLLPILDVGEALFVGDASLLPTRVRVDPPTYAPASGTVAFWEDWAQRDGVSNNVIHAAVEGWRKQTTS